MPRHMHHREAAHRSGAEDEQGQAGDEVVTLESRIVAKARS